MKTKHTLIFTLITFVMLTLVSNSFAQADSPEYVVRILFRKTENLIPLWTNY